MSDTTFVHEIRPDTPLTRVTLTMDYGEVGALGMIAAAAVDASVLLHDAVDDSTGRNAQEILRWALRASEALEALDGAPRPTDGQE